jgi:putative glutamine amidotransferase
VKPVIALLCGTLKPSDPTTQTRDAVGRAYSEAVRRAGGAPVLVPLGGDEATLKTAVSVAHGLIITGGVDIAPGAYGEERLPKCGTIDLLRDDADRWALQQAAELGLPVLGTCRGIQSLAAFLGGSLYQDLPTQAPSDIAHKQDAPRNVATHDVAVMDGTLLARIVGAGPLGVNTFHHQAVKGVPPGFRVSARAADGIIEAIEATDGGFVLGVQWHPEDLAPESEPHQALFGALVEAGRG